MKKTYVRSDLSKRVRLIPDKRFHEMNRAYFTLDVKLFYRLLDIYMRACNGNYSQAARFLGVSRPTLIKWRDEETPPPFGQWYWPMILINNIKQVLIEWSSASSRKFHTQRQHLIKELNQVLREQETAKDDMEYAEWDPAEHNPRTYLLSLFRTHTRVTSALLERESRFSKVTLSRAARELGLVRHTVGFGPDKQTSYTLPDDLSWGSN